MQRIHFTKWTTSCLCHQKNGILSADLPRFWQCSFWLPYRILLCKRSYLSSGIFHSISFVTASKCILINFKVISISTAVHVNVLQGGERWQEMKTAALIFLCSFFFFNVWYIKCALIKVHNMQNIKWCGKTPHVLNHYKL